MPISERIETATDARSWVDAIPFHYEYTAGVAGEAFLRGLIEGRILGGYCADCDLTYLPARIYCVECYARTARFVRVAPVGVVKALTRTMGNEEEKTNGPTYGFVQFQGVRGGLVHLLLPGVRVGTKVKPVFKPKPQRTGALTDIIGFERSG